MKFFVGLVGFQVWTPLPSFLIFHREDRHPWHRPGHSAYLRRRTGCRGYPILTGRWVTSRPSSAMPGRLAPPPVRTRPAGTRLGVITLRQLQDDQPEKFLNTDTDNIGEVTVGDTVPICSYQCIFVCLFITRHHIAIFSSSLRPGRRKAPGRRKYHG